MHSGIYVMLDKKVGYMQPTFDRNDDSAIRNFQYAISTQDFLGVHATDFALYRIGTYDSETGMIEPLTPSKFLVDGVSTIGKEK